MTLVKTRTQLTLSGRSGMLSSRALPVAAFAAVLAFALWAYCLALKGTWHFDDSWILSGLDKIDGPFKALQFLLGVRAGPTGRPMELFSFALTADAWPYRPT